MRNGISIHAETVDPEESALDMHKIEPATSSRNGINQATSAHLSKPSSAVANTRAVNL